MARFGLTRKIVIGISVTLLILISLEVYAHTYVQPNYITATPKENAVPDFPSWNTTYVWLTFGNYTFTNSNSNWLVEWCVEEPKQDPNGMLFITIYKTGENASFLASSTGITFSSLNQQPNPKIFGYGYDLNPYANSLYNDKTTLNYKTGIVFLGAEEINLTLTVSFYQETILGIIPTGEQSVSIQAPVS